MAAAEKKVIGRREEVDLPKWDLYEIEAKVDTGAYTSSLHCHQIKQFDKRGEEWVRFNLLDPSHAAYNEKSFELPIYAKRDVKSSNGLTETRYIVKTDIVLFNNSYEIELSLTDRTEMKYPLLLGRRFLSKRFIVDVSNTNLSKKSKGKVS